MKKTLLFYVLIALVAVSCRADDVRYKNYSLGLAVILETSGSGQISILIDKSDYKLTVVIDTVIIKEYPAVFGKNPLDDKLRQGDRCTPEGTFKVVSKYPHDKWSKFILINYPTDDSWHKHYTAKNEARISGNSKIGGEIGIHGVPNDMDKLIDLHVNWTLGCVSMKNRDIDELYPFISGSTMIVIRK